MSNLKNPVVIVSGRYKGKIVYITGNLSDYVKLQRKVLIRIPGRIDNYKFKRPEQLDELSDVQTLLFK